MTIYPVEFHRRLEQKWASRIDQILTVTGKASPPRDPNDDEDEEEEEEEDEERPDEPAVVREPDKDSRGLGYRCDVAQLVMTGPPAGRGKSRPVREPARRAGALVRSPCQSPYKCPRNCSIAPWHNRSGLHSPALASSMSRLAMIPLAKS